MSLSTTASTTTLMLLANDNTTTLVPPNTTDPSDLHTKDESKTGGIVIFGIFATILFAAGIERAKSKNPVPFTICMILFGIVVGIIAQTSAGFENDLLIADMSPLDTLNVFLPILIFDGAYNLKLSTLLKVSFGSVLLAGPGVLVNAFAMAFIALGFYGHWTLAQALMFGSIVSATDPVAVIARLKDLDADRWTTTLTDGEAIMNDGTAVVLYEMLRGAVTKYAQEPSAGDVVVSVVRYCFLPLPVGMGLGWIVGLLERRSPTKPIVVTAIQLSGAYTAYYLAADVIETSTVLTLMFMALYMSYQKAAFPKGEWDQGVKHFWEILVWIANSLLFALVGLISVLHVWRTSVSFEIPHILLMYLALNGVRAVMLLGAWPLINWGVKRDSERMNWRRWAMLTYGGLRGGIALLLGLAVLQERHNDPAFAKPCFAQCAGIVLLTSIINGWTAGPVVSMLGLDAQARFSHHAVLQAVDEIRATAEVRLERKKMEEDDVYWIDWNFIHNFAVAEIQPPTNKAYSYEPLMTRSSTEYSGDAVQGIRRGGAEDRNNNNYHEDGDNNNDEYGYDENDPRSAGTPLREIGAPKNAKEALERSRPSSTSASASNAEPESDYVDMMSVENKKTQNEQPLVLSARGSQMLQSDSSGIRSIIDQITRSSSSEVMIPILLRVMKRELWRMYDQALLAGRTISVLENFFDEKAADKELFTAEDMHDFLSSDERWSMIWYKMKAVVSSLDDDKAELLVSGMTAFNRIMKSIHHTVSVLYGSMSNVAGWMEWARIVLKESQELANKVRNEHPKIARVIDSRRVAQEILAEAQEHVEAISLMTGLTGKQREWLKSKLFRLTFNVSHENPPELISDNDLIRKVFADSSIVAACNEEQREHLWKIKELKHAKQNENVPLDAGKFGIVVSGKIMRKDAFTHKLIPHVATEYFGLSACVRRVERFVTFRAATDSVAFISLPYDELQKIMKVNPECRDAVYRTEAAVVTEPLLSQVYPTCELSPFQRKVLAEHAQLLYIEEGTHHPVMSRVAKNLTTTSNISGNVNLSAPASPSHHHSGAASPLSIDALSSPAGSSGGGAGLLASPLHHNIMAAASSSSAPASNDSLSREARAAPILVGHLHHQARDHINNRTTFLLRGHSPELPGPHCMTLLPETFSTRWEAGETVLLVLNDLRLTTHTVPITGIFFLDRSHVHIDAMLTSFKQSNLAASLFTLDRLLYALTEYVPCIYAVRWMFEKSGINLDRKQEKTSSPSKSEKDHLKPSKSNDFSLTAIKKIVTPVDFVEQTSSLIDSISEWLFLRHTGGINASDLVKRLERYFEIIVQHGPSWSAPLLNWTRTNSEPASPDAVARRGGRANTNPNNNNNSSSKASVAASAAAGGASSEGGEGEGENQQRQQQQSNKEGGGTKLLSGRWFESAFEVLDPADLEEFASKHGYKFPIRKSKLVGQGAELRMAASTIETVFDDPDDAFA